MSVGVHAAEGYAVRSSTSRRKRCGGRNATCISAVAPARPARGPVPRSRMCHGTIRGRARPRARLARRPGRRSPHGRARGTVRPRSRCRSRRRDEAAAAGGHARRAVRMPGGGARSAPAGGDCSSEPTMRSTRSGTGSAGRMRTAVRTRGRALGEGTARRSIPRRARRHPPRGDAPRCSPSMRAESASCARSQFIAPPWPVPPPRHRYDSSSAIAAQSAWRARNIRLFTVPGATASTSAASR